MPVTRGRTSASREPAVCAGDSRSIATVFGCTSWTATSAGGMPPCIPPGGPDGPHAARTRQRGTAKTKGERGAEDIAFLGGVGEAGPYLTEWHGPKSNEGF